MPRKLYNWKEIRHYHDAGHGFVDCQKRFFSHTAWIKAIKRGKLIIPGYGFRDCRRRYDWSVIQAYYDEGHSYRRRERFGFNAASWDKARRRRDSDAPARYANC